MEIVLVHPEIPPNTGSTARLAAAVGVRLHLIEPIGFSLESKYLKRAGLDYWPDVDMQVHPDWKTLTKQLEADSERSLGERLRLFTARSGTSLFDVPFSADDILVFGCESKGLPPELLTKYSDNHVRVPMRNGVRSLNLASTVCLGAYVALNAADEIASLDQS
ncbi:MAG: tRNA (cytidine/uridine-2'-O-)-methyltransferase, partial [Myxococcota bacterium]|jgi:tRNA (cytidine/uridine-2'-O-)-methyltransferase